MYVDAQGGSLVQDVIGCGNAARPDCLRVFEEIFRSQTRLPDGSMLISGKWKKAGIGSVDILFGWIFNDVNSIVVVVSPNYGSPVGGIETVSAIQADRFQVTSVNAAPEFVINWVAIGK